jgi:ABC-type nitrate/sulfonate/bicarbonate transport system substrate-binding protein
VAASTTAPSTAASKTRALSLGRQPNASASSPISQYMLEQKLFEQAAKSFGYDLTVDYQDYPSAAPMVELMTTGKLDIGMWGNTPTIRSIAQQQPVTAMTVGEGHLKFVVTVPADSSIHNIPDLKGKTVGALIGGATFNVLSQMLKAELGEGDPQKLGITVVNTPSAADAARLPRGMDAAVIALPSFLQASRDVQTTAIVNSFGYSEAAYSGPEGSGAGHLLNSAKNSPFAPEGYYADRAAWVIRNAVVDADPQLVTAFALAQQQAITELNRMDHGQVAQLVQKYWQLSPELGRQVVDGDLLFERGWAWVTEGDVRALILMSNFMADTKQIDQPLGWDAITASLQKVAPLLEVAYDQVQVPPAATFQDTTHEPRGYPTWQSDQWTRKT